MDDRQGQWPVVPIVWTAASANEAQHGEPSLPQQREPGGRRLRRQVRRACKPGATSVQGASKSLKWKRPDDPFASGKCLDSIGSAETDKAGESVHAQIVNTLVSAPHTKGDDNRNQRENACKCRSEENGREGSLHTLRLLHEVPDGGRWCTLQGLNLRPLPCEGSALPLS